MSKMLGLGLLIAGAILIVYGFSVSNSAATGLACIFHGAPSNKVLLLLLAGSASATVGWSLIRPGGC